MTEGIEDGNDRDERTGEEGGSLELRSPYGTTIRFMGRWYDGGRLDGFVVELEGEGLRARRSIGLPPWGGLPPSQLFSDLAAHWAGWPGAKTWTSIEGDLRLSATCGATGHVALEAVLPPAQTGPDWQAVVVVRLMAGEQDRIAAEAAAFFGPIGGAPPR